MALTQTQEKIGRFIANNELRQPLNSPYFAVDGGVSIQKVASNVVMSLASVQSDTDAMATAGQLTKTVRTSGVGLKATQALFDAIAAIDATNATTAANAVLPANRTSAKGISDSTAFEGIQWRAIALVTLDELNNLRQWLASFKTEVAAATTLADLKTRVGTLPAMPDRTITQVKTAYKNKIDAGTAD